MSSSKRPSSSVPLYANFSSSHLTHGAGVAIFHLASARVVVCYHSRDDYWFLPKGRRNVGETIEETAIREGFEESGYRNRLLPLPLPHHQPPSDNNPELTSPSPFVIEPIWTQLIPQTRTTQYILSWYAAETLPPDDETALNNETNSFPVPGTDVPVKRYALPPAYPTTLTLKERIQQDTHQNHDPPRHMGTGVDSEEALYEAYLLPIAEARQKLHGSIMSDVVKRAWDSIQLRGEMESTTTHNNKA